MKKVNQGFTLIELMIVITIIGILAAVGLPAYQDYSVRAKASEMMLAVSPSKNIISEKAIINGSIPDAGTVSIANITAGMINDLTWTGISIQVTGDRTQLGIPADENNIILVYFDSTSIFTLLAKNGQQYF